MKTNKTATTVLCIIAGFVLLALFAGFSKWVKGGGLKDTDFAVTVKIQERIDTSSRLRLAQVVGNVMEGATFFASPEVSTLAVLVLTGFAIYDRKKKRVRWSAFIIPVAFFLIVAGELYGKSVVHHPAPPFYMIKNPTTIFPKFYINEEFSYPSGHTARAVFLVIIVSSIMYQVLQKQQRGKRMLMISVLVAYVALVAISRIYLGHHWLSDILGGVLLGTSMGVWGTGVL